MILLKDNSSLKLNKTYSFLIKLIPHISTKEPPNKKYLHQSSQDMPRKEARHGRHHAPGKPQVRLDARENKSSR